jgi:hypothetical protein
LTNPIVPKLMPPGNVAGSPKAVEPPNERPFDIPNPVSDVDVIWPVVSDWLESLKTFRTSICELSGGDCGISNSAPSFSPGSLTPFRSERSAAVGPPSTANGPRSFESRCVWTGKTLMFSRPGGSE